MLRVLYISGLFKWQGGSWRFLCCGCFRRCDCPCANRTAPEGRDGKVQGSWTADGLKRRLVKESFTPALVLSSIVADIDVVTDWYFFQSDDLQESGYDGIITAALVFTVLGTMAWLMLATDGLGWLKINACPGDACGKFGRYWTLINTLLEDLPQLVITFLTTGLDSVPGVLNVTAASFAFLAKSAEAYGNRGNDLPTNFEGVTDDVTRSLVEERLDLEDRVAAEVDALREATNLISRVNKHPDLQPSMQATFTLARDHRAFIHYVVKVVGKVTLGGTGLTGMQGKPALARIAEARRLFSADAFALLPNMIVD